MVARESSLLLKLVHVQIRPLFLLRVGAGVGHPSHRSNPETLYPSLRVRVRVRIANPNPNPKANPNPNPNPNLK